MKRKSLLFLLLLALFAPWAAMAQTPSVTIGSGTATSAYLPGYNYYNYAISQQIYTAEEINASGTITSISFYKDGTENSNGSRKFDIYMAHTTKTGFEASTTTTKDWIALTDADIVYHGTANYSFTNNAWNTFTLETPFNYNGTDNLVVCVIDRTGNCSSSSSYANQYRVFSTGSEYQAIYKYNDNYSSLTPDGHNGTTVIDYSRMTSKNQIILGGIQQTCARPTNLTATLDDTDHTIATLSWTENGEATSWVLQYSEDNTFTTGVQSFNVSGTSSKDLTGLTPEHTYYARVRPSCSETLWSDVCEFKPTAAQHFTVNDGTTTSDYVPVYGYWADNKQQSEFIIPSTSLTDIAGSTLKAMKFYANYNFTSTGTFQVYLREVENSTFSNTTFYGTEGATTVYTGTITVSSTDGMTITFANDGYAYNGGNLLIGFYQANGGNCSSSGAKFYGISANGASISMYSSNAAVQRNFLPKTTFTYLPSATPKPRNIQVSDITVSQATISWEAPATGTPTGYEYQIKVLGEEWPTSWISAGNSLSVEHTGLTASTDYVVRVRATYAEGESDPIETEFRTLDACAFPTNFTATTTPGVGTDANFSWVKGYDETAWNLQLATDVDFNNVVITYFTEDGFVVDGNNVTFHATTLTPEQTYYARVQADCGSGSTSVWSNVETLTPSNYVDFTFKENATSSTPYTPFYGSATTNATNQSQCVIPASELVDLTGGIIRRITYYTSSTTTTTWGGVTFNVYMAEVDNTEFPSTSPTFYDWTSLTNVYTGTVSLSNGMMAIDFDNNFTYNGGNLLIGFKTNTVGTAVQYIYWTANYESTYNELYQYGSNNAARSCYLPKITFSYQPTPYKKPVIDEASCTFETTTAHIAWTVTGATPTGYQYQYKPASATEWPSAWTSVTTAYADLSDLTPGSFYDFRVKALYDGGNESVVVDYSFVTECAAITAFPWSEKFEAYSAGDFSHPCWVNEHISGEGTSIFKVYTSTNGSNTTHQLQLPDQTEGTLTKLRLPEMNLPSNDYQFVIDVYRSSSTYNDNYPYEGIRVFASTDGNIEGATELTFIPRQYNVSSTLIPEESEVGWYTYEIPIGVSGTCYIILRGESQFCTSTYMDNLTVEQISTCARPSELASSNVTNHSATIEWTAGDAEQTLWQIAYSKTNFDPNTANFDVTTVTTIDATAHPFTLDKILDPESTYYVYVRANCGTAAEPDFGPWSRKGINFTTQVATPAPSNFVATNPASEKVDMTWNAGGGDFESWEIYYVASETAPDAPTASTQASVSDITTLPTTENPYVLDGLTATTKYYAWVRAKHVWNNETTYSDWVALTSSYFETLDACPTPTDLVATNLTSVSADLSWVGSDDVDSYTVQYRTAAGMGTTVLSEEFDTSIPTDWENKIGLLSDVMAGTATLSTGSQWYFGTGNGVFDNHARINIYGSGTSERKGWLITKAINVTDGTVLSFDLALTAYSGNNVPAPATNGTDDRFVVLVTTDNEATWESLREWNNSGSAYVYNNIANTATGQNVVLDLSNYKGNSVKIAFYGESTVNNADNYLHIDNVMVGTPTPAGNWIDATTNVEEQSFQLTGLTAGTKYDVRVKSNCTSGEYCEPVSFTTLAEGNMVFTNATNDGKWGNSGNWAPAQLPVLTDEVILRANATIESGCEAQAKKITFEGSPTPTLTIADGGQLITNTAVTARVQKVINAHGTTTADGGWNFIASPINNNNLSATSVAGLITDNLGNTANSATATYDFYYFKQNPTLVEGIGKEWMNYRNETFSLANGKGYLYASLNGTTLNFTGSIKALPTTASQAVSLTYASESTTQDMTFIGWNLVGNPFTFDAAVDKPYYTIDENGTAIPNETTQANVRPCTGIMVKATGTGQSITFSKPLTEGMPSNGNLAVALAQANVRNNAVMDKAIISFNEGNDLSKFYFGNSDANIYFPQDNKEFAIVSSEGQGEMPLNFRAYENGSYTLSFTAEEVAFSYLHLIDNMTGKDIDLLQAPSYSFNATTNDYESRFRLVFATGSSIDGESFGFFNGNGNFSIIGIEGTATLQVIDVMGRMLSSETFNGSIETKISDVPGVYMLRLVNGNEVRTQKVIVK